jgi:hypothetical protein
VYVLLKQQTIGWPHITQLIGLGNHGFKTQQPGHGSINVVKRIEMKLDIVRYIDRWFQIGKEKEIKSLVSTAAMQE